MTGFQYPQQNPFMGNNYPRFTQNNGITWVQGREGAKAYQMMPNSNTILMDSDTDGVFYIKVSDNVGMCTLRTFKYEEVSDVAPTQLDTSKYITREEFESVINNLKGVVDNGKQPLQSTQSNTTRLMSEQHNG